MRRGSRRKRTASTSPCRSELGVRDVLLHMVRSLGLSDYVMIVAATLAVTLLGMLLPAVNSLIFGRWWIAATWAWWCPSPCCWRRSRAPGCSSAARKNWSCRALARS
ncbi:MAG: hypothetical protein ACLTMP_02410 [Eggerthella lenta]